MKGGGQVNSFIKIKVNSNANLSNATLMIIENAPGNRNTSENADPEKPFLCQSICPPPISIGVFNLYEHTCIFHTHRRDHAKPADVRVDDTFKFQ